MPLTNGLLIYEAVKLYADVAPTDIIPKDISLFTYDSIGLNGEYIGLKQYIGSDIEFQFLIPYPPPVANPKVPKAFSGADMSGDCVFSYELTSGDIALIGATIQLTGLLVNKQNSNATYTFSASQGSLVAGDTIDFIGLPLKADVNTITFNLS